MRNHIVNLTAPLLQLADLAPGAPARWFQVRVSYAMFSTANTTSNLDQRTIGSDGNPWVKFPPGIVIHGAGLQLIQEFSGGTVGSATLSVGTTSSSTAYVLAKNVFTGAGAPIAYDGVALNPHTLLNTGLGLGTIRVALVTTVANASALTQGLASVNLLLSAVDVRSTSTLSI